MGKQRIIFWRGCTLRNIIPEVVQRAEYIFGNVGIDIITIDDEGCCGYPFLLAGYTRHFAEYASKVVSRVGNIQCDFIVVHCPGCLRTFLEIYPKYGFKFPKKVVHTTQYIHQLLRGKIIKLEKRVDLIVTYHDPCDLCRHMGICNEPREIIKSIPGVTFIEMAETSMGRYSRCCGGGGLLRLAIPALATQIATDRIVEDIAGLGVQAVVTACPTCVKTLSDAKIITESLYGISIDVLDIIDVMYIALR